jgi:hypothetical protein
MVRAGDDAWHLHADTWGATLTRTEQQPLAPNRNVGSWLPRGVEPVSAAALADVAAVTTAASYHVLIVEPGTT